MKTFRKSAPDWIIGTKIGTLTCLALIAYFLTMKMLGLHLVLELRLFNFAILAFGICTGINRLRQELGEGEYYLQGLAQGLIITGIAVIGFAVFFVLYLLFFDYELIDHIRSSFNSTSNYINVMTVFIALIMEGFASGAIISFSAMQYFKTSDIKSELKKELSSPD